ncbi:MAG TPA: HXXEE domain-containing protein [Anaerolineaceae bacterium]|nr:HXXEE domain-containing protein [Anaerolineaceae bacterium]HPN53765.1 HXXEE domain-containing protein [Anaerolineaceae bacterium]
MSKEMVMWLLPLVFMFHDFEEILMMSAWSARNADYIRQRFPGLAGRFLDHPHSTAAFSLAVAEEFVLFSVFTVCAVQFQWFTWWTAFAAVFLLHNFIHIGQWILFRRYVPCVITAVLTSLYCIGAIWFMLGPGGVLWSDLLVPILVLTLAVGANLGLALRLAGRFETWLKRYAQAAS